MKKVVKWFGGGDGDPTLQNRRMVRRSLAVWLTLAALGIFWLIPSLSTAQDKKEEPKPAAPAAQEMPKEAPKPPDAPAAAPADTGPKGDPNGSATGDENTAIDASGAAFPVADPGKPPDPKDPDYAKLKKDYDDKKKAFDEYTAQVAKEPLALKLAKAVGHNRVSMNMMWTLITGFLVMFMQAGFALVETGLTRAKNVSHTMAMNFMVYPLGMLGFY